jgi:hypothetical protein
MVSVSLKDFVATSVFGPVALGSASEAVKAAFGEPEAAGRTFRKCRRPNLWKYGDVEFVFAQHVDEMDKIHIDRFSGLGAVPQGWGALRREPWVIREGLASEKLITALEEAGYDYHLRAEPQFNQVVIVLQSGVEIGFISAPDEFSTFVGLAWLTQRARFA